jgi:hypothetical protein
MNHAQDPTIHKIGATPTNVMEQDSQSQAHDLKPMSDEEHAAYAHSLSLGALQREFSPSSRLLNLYGPCRKKIEDLIKSRQSVPRHESSNEPGK